MTSHRQETVIKLHYRKDRSNRREPAVFAVSMAVVAAIWYAASGCAIAAARSLQPVDLWTDSAYQLIIALPAVIASAFSFRAAVAAGRGRFDRVFVACILATCVSSAVVGSAAYVWFVDVLFRRHETWGLW